MFDTIFDEIHFYYSESQPLYDNLNVVFKKGLPVLSEYPGNRKILIIVDDQMGGRIGDFFVKGTHHRNLSIIYIVQNLFHQSKDSRDISINSHYIVVMKSPRDRAQINYIGRQCFPSNSKFIGEAYADATRNPHSYLLLDFTQNCPEEYRVRTSIFPDEETVVYIPK